MKIFLSYASEDREVAEEIQLALSGAGHRVFYDKASLPAAGDYHGRIQQAVREADAFVFVISPHSVGKGNYALTELKFARDKWPHPKGRVVPVRLHDTPFSAIPVYLKSVTVLEPEGNVAAEVAAAVAALAPPPSEPMVPAHDPEPESRRKPRKSHKWVWIGIGALVVFALWVEYREDLADEMSSPPPFAPPAVDAPPPFPPAAVDAPAADIQGANVPNAPAAATPPPAGSEQTEAARAATEILSSIRNGEFDKLWNTQTSSFFKSRFPRATFIENLRLGQLRLGPVLQSQFVDMAYSQQDPATGVRGEIYAFNYITAYGPGRFYERIVVVKEADGRFRLAGIWSAPAPL